MSPTPVGQVFRWATFGRRGSADFVNLGCSRCGGAWRAPAAASAARLFVRPVLPRFAIVRRCDISRRLRRALLRVDHSVCRRLRRAWLALRSSTAASAPARSGGVRWCSRQISAFEGVPGCHGLFCLALRSCRCFCRLCCTRRRPSAPTTPTMGQSRGFAALCGRSMQSTLVRDVLGRRIRQARARRLALNTFGGLGAGRLCADPIAGRIVGRMWHQAFPRVTLCGSRRMWARGAKPADSQGTSSSRASARGSSAKWSSRASAASDSGSTRA